MGGLSKTEWLIIGGIVLVVVFIATRSKQPISGANVYGMTGKTPISPSEVLAFQNANEQSATRQDQFNLAKLNIASGLIKDSMAYQNQARLIDKVSANDLALLKQQQSGQRQQSLLQALSNLLSGITGGSGGGRSSGSGGSGSGSGGGSGGGFTPPFIGRSSSRNAGWTPVEFPDPYNGAFVLDINALNGSYGYPSFDLFTGWDFGPAPPTNPNGSGEITGFFDNFGNPIDTTPNDPNQIDWSTFFTGD